MRENSCRSEIIYRFFPQKWLRRIGLRRRLVHGKCRLGRHQCFCFHLNCNNVYSLQKSWGEREKNKRKSSWKPRTRVQLNKKPHFPCLCGNSCLLMTFWGKSERTSISSKKYCVLIGWESFAEGNFSTSFNVSSSSAQTPTDIRVNRVSGTIAYFCDIWEISHRKSSSLCAIYVLEFALWISSESRWMPWTMKQIGSVHG